MDEEPAEGREKAAQLEEQYEVWMAGVAMSDAREAVADIRCSHGEPVSVTTGPPRADGTPLLSIHAHCLDGRTQAQAALGDLGADWND
jgi:hypothetical protein